MWGWGYNFPGQLGNGTTNPTPVPVRIGIEYNWKTFAVGGSHVLALKEDGSLWSWGANFEGQLGIGGANNYSSPVRIGNETGWKAVSAGHRHSLAIKSDGSQWAWGHNGRGQLGNGTTTTSSVPIQVGTQLDWKTIEAGYYHSMAIRSNGSLWAWGYNESGQLGDGSKINRSAPVQIGNQLDWISIAAGLRYSLALKADGSLWSWGNNSSGQLGDHTFGDRSTPEQISAAKGWTSISAVVDHSIAITDEGKLYTWGQHDTWGALGVSKLGNMFDFPIRVGAQAEWESIFSEGASTFAIKADGSLWAWGSNNFGTLGDGTTLSKTTPIQIGADTDWKHVGAGSYHVTALKKDGTLWGWGYNNWGQVGDGTTTQRLSPVQIGTDNDWRLVVVAGTNSYAIKADGSLWGWGYNGGGTLGDGTYIDRHSPIQIGTDTNWEKIVSSGNHVLALKTDGSLWGWGYNRNGELGDGTKSEPTYIQHTPKQIGNEQDWAEVVVGENFSLAIKQNGSLWAWGDNYFGALGDGSTVGKLSPTRIGTDEDWKQLGAGRAHTLALKTDGSLWGWGNNYYGQLGIPLADTTYLAPVKVGGDKKWQAISVSYSTSFGLMDPACAAIENAMPVATESWTGSLAYHSEAVYAIGEVSGATAYEWTVPAAFEIVSGQQTTAIRVRANSSSASGQLSVRAVTACGEGPALVADIRASKARASVLLDELQQEYTGEPRAVRVLTDPAGLRVEVRYNGSEEVPAAVGEYDVSASVVDEHYEGEQTARLVISAPTAIEDSQKPETLLLYPNPTEALATLWLGEGIKAQVTLTDIRGRVLHTSEAIGSCEVNLTGFEAGVYVVKVVSKGQEVLIYRLMKR